MLLLSVLTCPAAAPLDLIAHVSPAAPPPNWQVVNGSVFIAGESPSYESRLLNLKRQLFRLWRAGGLPEGIDVRAMGAVMCCAAAAAAAPWCLLLPPCRHRCHVTHVQSAGVTNSLPAPCCHDPSLFWSKRTGRRCVPRARTAPFGAPSLPPPRSPPTLRMLTCCWRQTTPLPVGAPLGLSSTGWPRGLATPAVGLCSWACPDESRHHSTPAAAMLCRLAGGAHAGLGGNAAAAAALGWAGNRHRSCCRLRRLTAWGGKMSHAGYC